MRVLVTGAGGSIGAHLIIVLLMETDWDIVATDSFNHKGELDRLATIRSMMPSAFDKRVTTIRHDLTAPFTSRQVKNLKKIDHIIHLASLSDVQASIDDPVPFVRNNVEITLTVLELARKLKPKSFVLFSTDEVYGSAKKRQGHPEWDTILPSNPYAASKAAQEAIAISYWRSYGVPLIITNTMNNFGAMQQPSKYPVIIQKAVEQGKEVTVHTAADGTVGTRYYIHSQEAARAVLFILQNTVPYAHRPGEVDRPDRYNIVGSKQLSNLELAQRIADLMGKELKYSLVDFHSKQPGHDLHYGLDGKKLKKLGYKPKHDFDTYMQATIAWQQEHKDWIE